MTFPMKFKHLLELTENDVCLPDYAWLTFVVCACEKDSCGWGGWIIEAIAKKDGNQEKILNADYSQKCPECGKVMYRTEVSIKFEPSGDQSGRLIEGKDYESMPIEYDDEE